MDDIYECEYYYEYIVKNPADEKVENAFSEEHMGTLLILGPAGNVGLKRDGYLS